MLAVLVMTVVMAAGLGMTLGEFAKNQWYSYWDDYGPHPVFVCIFTWATIGLLYWWVIASVGLFWATYIMLVQYALTVVLMSYRVVASGGRYKNTLRAFVPGALVSITVLVGLWVHVLS
jgi:hypothetical protein